MHSPGTGKRDRLASLPDRPSRQQPPQAAPDTGCARTGDPRRAGAGRTRSDRHPQIPGTAKDAGICNLFYTEGTPAGFPSPTALVGRDTARGS